MEKKDVGEVEDGQAEKNIKRNEALYQLLDFRNNLMIPSVMVFIGDPDNDDEDSWLELANNTLKTPIELYSETRWGTSLNGTPWPQFLFEQAPNEIEMLNESIRKLNQAVLDRDKAAYVEISSEARDYITSFFS